MKNRHENHPHFLGSITLITLYVLTIIIAYYLSHFVYSYFGEPSTLWAHIITGILASILFILIIALFISQTNKGRQDGTYNALTTALKQISQGDFNVLLETNARTRHYELASTINEMAQNLGTLETMRQDFIYNVSHEIQSPLTSISGFATLLQKEDLSKEEKNHYASIIETESKRLSSLSDNLLKLSSLDTTKNSLHKKTFRFDKQLESIALTMEPQWAKKQIILEANLEKVTLLADENLLAQVWINLLHNAIKFTPNNGHISITLSANTKTATVTITDTGVGISPEDQMHIFERFYKADKARDRSLGGNGLGLSLVKRIVSLHGGQILVESEIYKGATFIVTLPLQ